MVQKNHIYTGEITGYTSDGMGVARIDGQVVFVKQAIAGEVCDIYIETVNSNAVYGRINKILEPSPHRTPRQCPYAKRCGGCDFWHMDYQEELRLKAQRVQDALTRLGGVPVGTVPILPSPQITGYRNKAQYPVSAQKGQAVAGFYREKTHQVIPVDRCLIQCQAADLAKDAVVAWMNRYHIAPYEESSHTGLVRHIYVRTGFATSQVLVCLVVNGKKLPRQKELVEQLRQAVPGLVGVVLSSNEKQSNVVLGKEFHCLYGQETLEDVLCNLRFRLSAPSFYQVNHDQAERLYGKVLEAAQLTKEDVALDLYCGTGTITLCLARQAGRAIGVEVIPEAIADAKENARRNGITNGEFFCADASQAAQELARRGLRPKVIVVDPPRKGIGPQVIEAMAAMGPERIVYVSCDPATLGRDVGRLTHHGYELSQVQAVDMFPRTAHVETVVSFVRKNTSTGNRP